MDKYDKKVIMNKVLSVIIETVWAMLIIVGILVLVAEDKTGCAVFAGIGLIANIIMIVNECIGIKVWLDIIETKVDNNTVIQITNSENK